MKSYSYTKNRVFQWIGILLSLGLIAVSYWYFSARAGVKTNTGSVQPQGAGNLDSGLAGYWKLDEGSGTSAADASTNSVTGTLTNGPTWTTGQIGSAVDFDGTNDYIDLGTGTFGVATGSKELTLSAWAYVRNFQSYPCILGKNQSGTPFGGWQINVNGDSGNRFGGGVNVSGSWTSITSNSTFSTSTWYHVTMTFDGVSLKLYVNGSLDKTVAASGTIQYAGSGASVGIGRNFATEVAQQYLNGRVDEARIYNRTLSSDEVSNLYRLTSPTGTDTGLKGYWSFNAQDMSGTTAYDRSGAGNTGTLTNSPTKTMGKVGQALSFDGTDDYVDATGYQFTTFSAAAWVKTNGSISDYQGIIEWTTSSSDRIGIGLDQTGDPLVVYRNASSQNRYREAAGVNVDDGNWHFIVGIFDGTNATMYVDGNSVTLGSELGGLNAASASSDLRIGCYVISICQTINGRVDEARVYNRVLSAAEVKSLYDFGESDEVNTSAAQSAGTGRPDSSLAGYWKMDDGSGTSATDSSTNGNTGTLTNGPTWTTGQIGGAVDFDGTNDYITAPNSSVLDIVDGESFTLSGWFNRDTFTSDHTLIAKRGSLATGNNGYALYIPGTGDKLTFEVSDSVDEYLIESVSTFTAAGWYHFALVWNDASAGGTKLYINGTAEAATTTGTFANVGTLTNTKAFTVGMLSDGNSNFDGKLDEIRMYDRTLSSDEVSNLYRLTSPTGTDTGLKGYWSFNAQDMSGTTAYDRSGAGNTGTLTNSPTKTMGKVGQALSFDGTDDYTTVADANSLDITSAISMAVWIKTTDTDSCIMSKTVASTGKCFEVSGNKVYELGVLSSVLYFQTSNGTTANVVSGSATPLLDNQWHHVVGVWDGTTSTNGMKIYIDGVVVYQGTATVTSIQSTSSALTFGGDGGAYDFSGSIDEGRLYNRALSVGEIKSLFNLAESDKVNTSVSQPQGTGRPDSSLAGYWKMDDGSGTSATDSSTNGNTGTLTNGPTWTTGQIGGAVDFDGTNDNITISDANNLDITNNLTVAVWVKADTYVSAGGYRSILSKGNFGSPAVNYSLRLYGANTNDQRLDFGYYASSAVQELYGSTNITTGTWYHLTVSYDDAANAVALYVNGRPESTTVASGSPSTNSLVVNSSALEIGQIGGVNNFDGQIDEVRLYSWTLSSNEISHLAGLASPTGTDTNLKGYWSFNGQDVSGTTAYDRSGSGNTGTISGDASKSIGKIGQGLSFGGTNGVVDMNDINAMDGVANVTLSAWMKRSAANSVVTVGKSVDQYRRFNINFYNDGNVYLNVGDGSGTPYGSFASNDTNWHHVVMVFDGSQSGNANRLKAYFDGVATTLTFSGTIPATTNNNSDDFTAGYAPSFGGYTVGKIDEVRLYNRSLTAAEVTDLYNQSK